MKNNFIALSIISLGICLLIGSILIANGLKNEKKTPLNMPIQHQLLTQSELAKYLGLSVKEIQKLGPVSNTEGVITSEIPYIKIGHRYYYSKSAIDRWLRSKDSITVQ
ncbi:MULTISPECIES: helix-turn-helix domain-containing protein [Bacillaceae]|uniref:helix-turn-helix domain-containing protein n=1 Tax=Bacillaceae TaxID=186817 RepID=UPI002FFECF3E